MALLISASAAAAEQCQQEEAQFRGTVTDVQESGTDACTYRIDYSDLISSAACPMNEEHAWLSRLVSSPCTVKEDDDISGYLIFKDGILVIEGRH